MGKLHDFRQFVVRGNVMDLAVAVVVGGAFGKITTSLVNDVVMPPVGFLVGDAPFKELRIVLQEAQVVDGVETVAEVAVRYGAFVNTVVDFLIVAASIFVAVQVVQSMRRKPEPPPSAEAPPPPPANKGEQLLEEIRDLIREGRTPGA
jgi:large conductance mechanosensitive channel